MSRRRGGGLSGGAFVVLVAAAVVWSSSLAAAAEEGEGFMKDFFFRFPEFGKKGRSLFDEAGKTLCINEIVVNCYILYTLRDYFLYERACVACQWIAG